MQATQNSDQLQALHRHYRESLSEKAALLDKTWLNQATWGAELLAGLEANLHQLAGSAGMYGFDALSAQARQLMQMASAEQVDIESIRLELKQLVAQMIQASAADQVK